MNRLLTAILSLVLLGGLAHAGNVRVLDNANVIPENQRNQLYSQGTRYPFDLNVFTGVFPSKRALDDSARECITGPNIVCIGVDPVHHGTMAHYGTATGVRPSDFNFIWQSGNSFFKSGDWAGGFLAIADRAQESARSASQTVTVQVPPPVVVNQTQSTGISGWWIFFGILALVLVIYMIYRLFKRTDRLDRDMGSYREERDEYLNANVDRMTAPTPTVRSSARSVPSPVPSAPSTVVVQGNSGGNDMLTGMLIGEAISRPRETVVEREVVHEHHHHESRSSDDDSGGSGGGWSSGWSGGGSSDSGGGGGDWGGGGGDFGGGGGFDGGGGGGDW